MAGAFKQLTDHKNRRGFVKSLVGGLLGIGVATHSSKQNSASAAETNDVDIIYGTAIPYGNIRSSPYTSAPIVDYLYCGELQERLSGHWGGAVPNTCTPNEDNWWWRIRWPIGNGIYGTGYVHGSVGADHSRNCC